MNHEACLSGVGDPGAIERLVRRMCQIAYESPFVTARREIDALMPKLLKICKAPWTPIDDETPTDQRMIIAGCPPCAEFPEGRVMIWRADILARNLKGPTPAHLRFPATHWMPMIAAPERGL